MNGSAEGGVWRSGHVGRVPGRAKARELIHDAHGFTPQMPDGRLHPRGDRDFGPGPGGAEARDTLDYSAIFRGLWRRKFLFIAIVILATGLATAIVVRLPSQYVAHALVVIGGPAVINPSSRDKGAVVPPDVGSVQTVVEVLRSPQLAAAVILRLNLEQNPEFNPAAAQRAETGVVAWARGMVLRVREWCCASQTPSGPHDDAEFSRTVDGFLSRLRVGIKDNSRMIDVAFESKDAQLAMLTANALVDEYIIKELEMQTQSARRTSDWLRDSIAQLQAKVESAERAVEEFRSGNGLFSMPGGSPLVLKQMTDVSAELADAQTARAAIEARVRQLRSSLAAAGRDGAIGGLVDSPIMQALHAEEADAQQELAQLSVKFGEGYPTTVGLKERLRSIHSAMRRENQRVVASLESDLRIARMKEADLSQRLSALKSDVAQMNGADITLRALERKAEADRRLLDDFIARLNATASQNSDTSSLRTDAQIASYAQLPVSPERPKKKLLILIAGIASLIGAAAIVHLLERSDRSLRSLDEVEGLLKVVGLGMLPISEAARRSAPEAARYGSTYREALKAIYLSLFGAREVPQIVVVTSAMAGEGKTTLALSLAAMAAQGGQRVMLLDADFWKKGASAALGFRAGGGLAEVLEGKIALPDAIISDVVSGTDIMLPGSFSRGSLLAWTGGFRELLESLRIRYDVVIIDTPPVLSASESTLIAKHADATVMTVRWGSTSRDAAAVASRKLHDAGALLTGSVITMVHERQHASYGYMDAAYFSGRFETYQSTPALAIARSSMTEDPGGRTPGEVQSKIRTATCQALLVVDMQENLGAPPRRSSLSKVVRNRLTETINGVSDLAARSGMAVVYAHQDLGRVTKGLSQLLASRPGGNHAIAPDTSLRMVSELSFPKPNPDAFSNPRLDRFLRENGINHLFIVGLDGATSINETAHSALARGYRVTFIHDGIFTAFDDRWRRLLKVFESAAAFAITREEFGEFCQRLRLRRGAAA